MWFGKDKNGYKYLRGKLSDLCSMTVFFEYGLSDGSRVYNVYLGSLVTEKGRKRKNPVYIKYARVFRIIDENRNEYLLGEISKGCYLRLEKQDKTGKSERYPDYIAYVCEPEDGTSIFNDDSTGDESIRSSSDENECTIKTFDINDVDLKKFLKDK